MALRDGSKLNVKLQYDVTFARASGQYLLQGRVRTDLPAALDVPLPGLQVSGKLLRGRFHGESSSDRTAVLVFDFLPHRCLRLTFWDVRREYIALLGSLIFILLEGIIRIITLGLRKPTFRELDTSRS